MPPDPLSETQQLLYALSHDLQEPLRAIISYSQLLDRQVASDPIALEYSAFIQSGANAMKDLLQHLLQYSRAGAAKRRSMLKLNVPLQRALFKLSPVITAASAKVVHGTLPEALADESEISLVFENILSNALKFRSAEPLEIVIETEQGSDECIISIRDNGPGIDPQYAEQVLLPFKRLHDKSIPGSGLGLAICDKIVRAHQGRLWIESDGVQGATVCFTLPS